MFYTFAETRSFDKTKIIKASKIKYLMADLKVKVFSFRDVLV